MFEHQVAKPVQRSAPRKLAGREYFILKRRLEWLIGRSRFAGRNDSVATPHPLIRHRSMLLRPLRDVDMYLQHNKVTNLRLAIERLDGIVIRPGETFSIWRNVGRPTASRGFLEGLVLSNGKIDKGIGGGLCQLGNLLYWMALHTPLTITERWRHGFDVFPDINRKIPFACGATLSYNYVDLQLRNDTPGNFRVKLWLDEENLNGELYGDFRSELDYEVIETDHQFRLQIWGGYTRHNRIWKRITDRSTGQAYDELIAENHAIMMYQPLLSDGNEAGGIGES